MSRLIDGDKLIKQLDDDIKITSEFVKKSIKYDDYHDFDKSFAVLYMLKSYRAIVEDMKTAFDVENKDIELIIEGLEKQVAKKPVIWADGTEHCPYCEHDLTYISSEDEYCCRCGQRLESE